MKDHHRALSLLDALYGATDMLHVLVFPGQPMGHHKPTRKVCFQRKSPWCWRTTSSALNI